MLRKGISPYFFMEIKMKRKDISPKERIVSSRVKKGYFLRPEYATSYLILFLGIIGSFFFEINSALQLCCLHLKTSSIMEIVGSLSGATWLKYSFNLGGHAIGIVWMYTMFLCSDKLKGGQK